MHSGPRPTCEDMLSARATGRPQRAFGRSHLCRAAPRRWPSCRDRESSVELPEPGAIGGMVTVGSPMATTFLHDSIRGSIGLLLDLQPGSNLYARHVTSTYTIGQVAERSGFSASALRYYEGIGLVAPSTRTGSGYRLYDDGSLARLAFIARAKQLGCTLEEITALVGIWDGERCGPVQRRFHDLVTDKLADTERQILELVRLRDELRHAANQLDTPPTDGPCSVECACMSLDRASTQVPLTRKVAAR